MKRWCGVDKMCSQIDFMCVGDMTDKELLREFRWFDSVFGDGVFDVVLMYRFEELMNEMEYREL